MRDDDDDDDFSKKKKKKRHRATSASSIRPRTREKTTRATTNRAFLWFVVVHVVVVRGFGRIKKQTNERLCLLLLQRKEGMKEGGVFLPIIKEERLYDDTQTLN